MIVHFGTLQRGALSVGDVVEMKVDHARRSATRANHSATHLLHEALRRVLGEHVTQKGSMVGPDRLRFDFSHPKPMSAEEIGEVEAIVNRVVRQNRDVTTRLMTPDEAIEAGALALFGEKYGDEVRVLAMGLNEDDLGTDGKSYSVELCGGTHVHRVGDIAIFKIVSESAVASGVRRIEALTAEGARLYLVEQDRLLREAAGALKIAAEDLPLRVASLMDERKRLDRELNEAKMKLAMGGGAASGGEGASGEEEIPGGKFIYRVLSGISPKDLKGLVDQAKATAPDSVIAFGTQDEEGKGALVVGVSGAMLTSNNSGDLVRIGVVPLGGKGGGGRPDMAQGGGPDGSKLVEAVKAVKEAIKAPA
jgi:alanyl-tRNA synthetase